MSQNISGNNNPTLRAQENARVSVDPDALSRAGSAAPQQAMTGLPNVSLKEAIVSEELRAMLNKAGLQRTESGAIAILDVKGTSATDGLSSAERVYGTGESQLSPAMPPAVRLTPELSNGAQSFATNLDIAMNNYLLTTQPGGPQALQANGAGTTTLAAPGEPVYFKSLAELSADDLLAAFLKVNITDPNNDPETHNKLHQISSNMRQLAIEEAKKRIERAQEAKKEAEQYAQQAEYISTIVSVISLASAAFTMGGSLAAMTASQGVQQAATQAVRQATNQAFQDALQQAVRQAVKDLGQNASQQAIEQAVQQAVQQTLQDTAHQEAVQQIVQEATQQAMQEGLQSGTQNAMQDAVQNAVQEALQGSLQESVQQGVQQAGQQVSEQVLNEAMSKGINQATQGSVQSAVSAARQGVQEGVQGAGQQAASQAAERSGLEQVQARAIQLGENKTLKNVGLATATGGKVVEAGAQYELAMKEADVAEWRNHAKRWELTADHHQDMVENEGQIMQEIMESKNGTVDAVMSMMNASFVSQQKLMAANMTR